MKFASIILSLILIVLSCLPCADGDSHMKHSDETSAVVDKQMEHSGESYTDLCSPFCTCNCCGVQILNLTPTLFFTLHEDIAAFVEKRETVYKSHFASTFSGSIWQPPQIV